MKNRILLVACGGLVPGVLACGETTSETELVARVGEHELTVDQVVELLADEERLAADVGVIESLANLWVDYTLLAEAVADDSTFARLDLEPMVQQRLGQTMLFQLRDSVIQVDTFITEEELEALYAEEAPQLELRARHIMLTYPLQATATQRDSVRGALQELRDRIVAGASFESMARQYSQDPGSSAAGGDLGFFARGDMMASFEEAALELEPGELSEVVESPLGLHLIRVDARRVRDFDAVAADFRRQVQGQRVQEAESTFVSAIESRVGPEIVEGAVEVVREIARNPGSRLSGRAARRTLIEWDGGAVRVGDLQELFQVEAPGLRDGLAEEDDEHVEDFLRDLARRELLIREARSAGLLPPRARIDTLVANAADQLREAARVLGFFDLDQAPGEPRELAIARAVEEALADIVTGATPVVPLGLVSFQLRSRESPALFDAGMGQAVVRIAQVRAARGLSPLEESLQTPDPTPPDTTAR
jgi:parvulin-like peptidyl-prolyl isomerase